MLLFTLTASATQSLPLLLVLLCTITASVNLYLYSFSPDIIPVSTTRDCMRVKKVRVKCVLLLLQLFGGYL